MPVSLLKLFALNASRAFGQAVAAALDWPLASHEERDFEDGEHKVRALESVRDADVYVIQSLYGEAGQSVNDKLVRLLFLLGAVRDAGAARVTAVLPYLAYARKDARTQPRDPLTTRYVAQLLEAVGIDRVVALEVHNLAAFQNAFRCRAEHLHPTRLFASYFARHLADEARITVVSPDPGGYKRAERMRRALAAALGREVELAFLEKARAGGVMSGGRLVGEVREATAIVVDDLISTGGTVAHAARSCRAAGARRVYAAAAHGLFVGEAAAKLAEPALERIVITDSVPPVRLPDGPARDRLEVLSVAALIAEAIERQHGGGSLTELLEG
jgi:ribose-phosphate pyrophosphokinase